MWNWILGKFYSRVKFSLCCSFEGCAQCILYSADCQSSPLQRSTRLFSLVSWAYKSLYINCRTSFNLFQPLMLMGTATYVKYSRIPPSGNSSDLSSGPTSSVVRQLAHSTPTAYWALRTLYKKSPAQQLQSCLADGTAATATMFCILYFLRIYVHKRSKITLRPLFWGAVLG